MTKNDLIKTYVKHGEKWFFVSTINRESSAAIIPSPVYAETIVWSTNVVGERQELLWQGEAYKGSIKTHQRVVEALAAKGAEGLGGLRDDED
jgi:hypothetical protein